MESSLRMVCGERLPLLSIHLGVGNGDHLNKTNSNPYLVSRVWFLKAEQEGWSPGHWG